MTPTLDTLLDRGRTYLAQVDVVKLSTRARAALAELRAVRDECEKASTELVTYTPKDPARDGHFHHAANLYEEAGETIECSIDNFRGVTELLAAEEAERQADAEPDDAWRGPVGR